MLDPPLFDRWVGDRWVGGWWWVGWSPAGTAGEDCAVGSRDRDGGVGEQRQLEGQTV